MKSCRRESSVIEDDSSQFRRCFRSADRPAAREAPVGAINAAPASAFMWQWMVLSEWNEWLYKRWCRYRTAWRGKGPRCGSFNYILVQDKEVTMETEIRTIRNPSRCNVSLFKLEQPHRRPAQGIECGPAALPIFPTWTYCLYCSVYWWRYWL